MEPFDLEHTEKDGTSSGETLRESEAEKQQRRLASSKDPGNKILRTRLICTEKRATDR